MFIAKSVERKLPPILLVCPILMWNIARNVVKQKGTRLQAIIFAVFYACLNGLVKNQAVGSDRKMTFEKRPKFKLYGDEIDRENLEKLEPWFEKTRKQLQDIRPKAIERVLAASCDLHFDGWCDNPKNKKHYNCPIVKLLLEALG